MIGKECVRVLNKRANSGLIVRRNQNAYKARPTGNAGTSSAAHKPCCGPQILDGINVGHTADIAHYQFNSGMRKNDRGRTLFSF